VRVLQGESLGKARRPIYPWKLDTEEILRWFYRHLRSVGQGFEVHNPKKCSIEKYISHMQHNDEILKEYIQFRSTKTKEGYLIFHQFCSRPLSLNHTQSRRIIVLPQSSFLQQHTIFSKRQSNQALNRSSQRTFRLPSLLSIRRIALLLRLGSRFLERLLEVGDDVIDVLGSD